MKKIRTLALCVAAIMLLLSGCTDDPGGSPAKEKLYVFNWGDYIDETVLSIFEEEFSVEVSYSTYDQNEDMYTKVKTSPGVYDVVIPSDYMIEKMIKEDMLHELNHENIPNLALINDYCKNLAFDPGNVYSIPYMWGTVGIVYNKTMVRGAIDSWGALWDPQYAKQIFMMNSVRDSMGIALTYLGYSMNDRDAGHIEEAKQKLIDQKPLVLAYTGDEIKDKMIAGEGALSVMYSGDAITVIEENSDLEYVVPKEGSNLWFDNACILKDSQNTALAEKFINFLCRKDIAEMNRAYINYSSPQSEVVETLPDEIKYDLRQYPDDAIINRCAIYKDLGEMVSTYDELWLEVVVN